MLPHVSLACPDGATVSAAERIARIALSPAAQAVANAAPPLTRQQLGTARAAFTPVRPVIALAVAA